nr:aplysianin-A-like [Crassostrea gigas]
MIVLITKLLCLAWLVFGKSKGNYMEDVTIIGAGIGGSYTGWRLRDKGWKIGIYEYSDRVGGRMYSKSFPDAPDLPVDFGAMRLRPEDHVRMIKAGRELGLTFVPFPEGGGRIPYYENVIQKTCISLEARKYIRDSSAFHTGLGPTQSNSRFLKTRQGFEEENTRPSDLPSYVTVPTGMNSFPVEFMRRFLVSNPKR